MEIDSYETRSIPEQPDIDSLYVEVCSVHTDISEHLPTLKEYAKDHHVTEFGVRDGVSTVALLAGRPKKLISYDINPCRNIHELIELSPVPFEFHEQNVLLAHIEKTDVLFIDSYHTQSQLTYELERHAKQVREYILLHDTESYGMRGEDGGLGILAALGRFLLDHPEWRVKKHFPNNNGLSIIERI